MLVTLQEIIQKAEEGNYAVPAFNVYNTETVMGVLDAAEEARSPVIMQVYPRLINQEVGYFLAPAMLAAAKKATVPVCFHLDHGAADAEVIRSLRWGATGIMFDGSNADFEENVRHTRSIVELCDQIGIGVEGEIGHVGSVNDEVMGDFTDPEQAAEFVRRTGVCCLAVLIGNLGAVVGSIVSTRLMLWRTAKIYGNAKAGQDTLEIIVAGNDEQFTVTALFDNLGKGASGAAIQNMNILLGVDETTGLNV